MKYLSEYTNQPITDLLEQSGAFYAFSQQQFNEKQKDSVQYVSFADGLIAPKENARHIIDSMARIHQQGIQQDLEENGRIKIIRRELNNFECFYTSDITDCVEALEPYGISEEEIMNIFRKMHRSS
jgi:hypothetical protein